MIQGEIEYACRKLKNDLGLRPVYHRLDDRIGSRIFAAFMALCLLANLRAITRFPGLPPRQTIDKFKPLKMVDIIRPTSDGHLITLPRHIEPHNDTALLLPQLNCPFPLSILQRFPTLFPLHVRTDGVETYE